MSLTVDYAYLAKIAPGKPKQSRRPKRRKGAGKKKHAAWLKAEHDRIFPKLSAPPGTLRYYLTVPRNRIEQAMNAGCKYNPASKRWYVDNPQNLAHFTAWRPSRVGFDQLVQRLKTHQP